MTVVQDGEATLDVWRRMLVMRALEERLAEAAHSGEVHGEMHVALGQESVSAVLATLLRDGDAVVSTHRPHLHALAAGVDPVAMIAEILERDGLNGGKGGHMHLFDPDRLFMCTGIVGANAPLALGYALSRRLLHPGGELITVCVLGDGSLNQGAVLESLNLAAVRSLPVLFLVEDNGYGISVPVARASAGSLERRGEPFGIPGARVDGGDLPALTDALTRSVAEVRSTGGPRLLVADVYRFSGHYEGDLDLYRSAAEKRAARGADRDPVLRTDQLLVDAGLLDDDTRRRELAAATATVDAWFEQARAVPPPAPATALTGELVA